MARTNQFKLTGELRSPAKTMGPRALRTSGLIKECAREVFLAKGYYGTSVEEIAEAAGVSRASFYTYFPSKRDVLVAVGAQSATESLAVIARLVGTGTTRASLSDWVADYFAFLDIHGSFSLAWSQAALEDDAIRSAGMKGHLGICRKLGTTLAATAGKDSEDPAVLGLVASSLLERYADTVERGDVVAQAAQALWGAVRQPSEGRRPAVTRS